MGRTGTTRRHALMVAGATGAGLLTACSSDAATDGTLSPNAVARAARAQSALRRRSAETSEALLRQYDAVLARHPGHRERLAPLRAAVARHVSALGPGKREREPGEEAEKPSASPSPSVSSSPPSSPTTSVTPSPSSTLAGAPAVPPEPAEALRALAAAERRTGDAHTDALVTASPELARLLASVAAANAAHAYLLTEGARS
ncbi:hypothetical protein ACFY7Z_00185 [Streptomyces sp. NPDC012623]|uniref:hypothetical protein n=1 Tax=unclassified Streptomyces TaxID=2593676 RepID=UPI00368090B3